MTTVTERPAGTLGELLHPLIWRELASIGAIDAALPRQPHPGYTFLYLESKLEKQANVIQMLTLLRLSGEEPAPSPGIRGVVMKLQTALTQATDTTATLRAMRAVENETIRGYTNALEAARSVLARAALRKALGRAIVQATVISAHIARRSGDAADARDLPRALSAYFATREARVCMRCLLDRPGRRKALERTEPRPYQYICAACYDEVVAAFPPDLQQQMDRWPEQVREDRVIHKALGRPAHLEAVQRVLHPLSGIDAEATVPAAERAVHLPDILPPPAPDDEPAFERNVPATTLSQGERRYVDVLFNPQELRKHW